MQEIEFLAAATLDDLFRLLAETGGRVIAGGTDAIVQMQRGVFPAQTLIDVSRITGLRFIREDSGRIHIGALTTYADVLASHVLHDAAPALVQAAATVGAPQTRARGTIGGNIGNASPAGDLLPPLLALDAAVTLTSAAGERVLPLDELLVGPRQTRLAPGEIIHSVSFAPLPAPAGAAFLKLGNRSGMAISVVSVAVGLALDAQRRIAVGRVALGAVAPRAVRSPHAEAVLTGQIPSPALFDAAVRAIQRRHRADQRHSRHSRLPAAGGGTRGQPGIATGLRTSEVRGMKLITIRLTVNGEFGTVTVEPNKTLLYVLREELGLYGVKDACGGDGECGACTVIMDGEPVNACLVLAGQAAGRRIETIEGLARDGQLHPLQQAFIDMGAVQCGFCTPGAVMSAKALLDRDPQPSDDAIREALSGNLCRCTGYAKMIAAVQRAAKELDHVR